MNVNSKKLKIGAAACLLALFWPLVAHAQMGGPALVRVAEASIKNIAPVTRVAGTVVSRSDARLSAEVPGRLLTVADVGTWVNQGEPVATIEDTRLRLQKAELQAQVARAEARLGFLAGEERRYTELAESNLAAATQLDQTRSDRDMARGDLDVARARLSQNEDQLSRTRIRAPFDGIVVERLMTPGERVVEGSNVVRLVDQQHLEVIARAPLEFYRFVEPGHELELSAGNQTAVGKVRTVVAVGDENTHQFEIRLDIEGNPYPVGQTLRIMIPMADSREVLVVPRDALVLRPEGQSIFVVDANNQAQQVRVTVGVGRGEDIEVQGLVSSGDRVVVRGNERLQPGQDVSILDS